MNFPDWCTSCLSIACMDVFVHRHLLSAANIGWRRKSEAASVIANESLLSLARSSLLNSNVWPLCNEAVRPIRWRMNISPTITRCDCKRAMYVRARWWCLATSPFRQGCFDAGVQAVCEVAAAWYSSLRFLSVRCLLLNDGIYFSLSSSESWPKKTIPSWLIKRRSPASNWSACIYALFLAIAFASSASNCGRDWCSSTSRTDKVDNWKLWNIARRSLDFLLFNHVEEKHGLAVAEHRMMLDFNIVFALRVLLNVLIRGDRVQQWESENIAVKKIMIDFSRRFEWLRQWDLFGEWESHRMLLSEILRRPQIICIEDMKNILH